MPSPSDDELLADAIPIEEADQIDIRESEVKKGADADLAPIELEETNVDPNDTMSKIRAFGVQREAHDERWQRQPNVTGQGAIHVKTFVAKLRLDAVEHLDEQVNQWLDSHPEYEVKFVSTSIGPLVGKRTEDALFLQVWV